MSSTNFSSEISIQSLSSISIDQDDHTNVLIDESEDNSISSNFTLLSSINSSSKMFFQSLSSISVEQNVHNIDQEDDEVAWLHQPIYENSDVMGGDALLKILRLYVKNKLSKTALVDILETVDFLLPKPNALPKSKFVLLKLIDEVLPPEESELIVKHRVCDSCFKNLGKWVETTLIISCPDCESNEENGMFLQYSIISVLKNAFEVRKLYNLIDEYVLECSGKDDNKLHDIVSGSEFKRLKNSAIPGKYD